MHWEHEESGDRREGRQVNRSAQKAQISVHACTERERGLHVCMTVWKEREVEMERKIRVYARKYVHMIYMSVCLYLYKRICVCVSLDVRGYGIASLDVGKKPSEWCKLICR